MITRETIDKIMDAANIVDVVGDYVTLKKQGRNYTGLCCFHADKNASLTVFPGRNDYKCFACGAHGNSVGFIMDHEKLSYPEALKLLAGKYGIPVEEKKTTSEEDILYKQKESAWASLKVLCNEYVNWLQRDKVAQTYAYRRWGEEYCKLADIGFCPSNAKIVDSLGISKEVSDALGLKNDRGYDFLQGRVTIPIRDLSGHVIGFTARRIDGKKECKYLNLQDSFIYSKSNSIFGIDIARSKGVSEGCFYLVEGAPDCMRLQSIDVENTLAPLGTAWTESHFQMMKRYVNRLCFIPDADPPKEGQKFGPGITAVMKSGRMAMEQGFAVTVKQIPVTEEKQDPDTYFTSLNIFNSIQEEDFVLWYASLVFEDNMTTAERSDVVNDVASLLQHIEDEMTLDMYISKLSQYHVTRSMWQKAVDKQCKQKLVEIEKAKSDKESEMYRKYGFNVEGNKYYSITSENGYLEWSNFIMKPLFHIKDSIMPKRLYRIKNETGTEELVELKQEDLVSLVKFKQKVEGLGNFIWKAGDAALTKLKSYLYEDTETAFPVYQLGWQRQGFFAFGNGVWYNGNFIKVDDYGIVRLEGLGNYYLPAYCKIYRDDPKLFQFERKFVHLGLSTISLKEYTKQIFHVFGNNGKVGFCFYLATLFRDLVTRETRSFPLLNLFGPKGSGKSELGHTLMSFFIIDNIPPNLVNATLPALNDAVAAVANTLVHVDEFKNDLDISKREFLKGIWDGTGRTRMNMDLDKKRETTSVDSGVIFSGQEMATADVALFSRTIFLSFPKSEFTQTEKDNYQILKRMRSQGMTHLTIELLGLRKKMESTFHGMYQATLTDVNDSLKSMHIEDRIVLNWVSILAVIRTLEASIKINLSYNEMFDICVNGIINQNNECRQNNELANFWHLVQFLVSEGELIEGGDFRIEYVKKFKSNIINDMIWMDVHPVLYIQKTRIFHLYKKHAKSVGDTILPEGSLKYYLESSNAYLGEKAVRYTLYFKGIVQFVKGKTEANGSPKSQSVIQRSFCFDYEKLKSSFEINIEKSSGSEDDIAEADEVEGKTSEKQSDEAG